MPRPRFPSAIACLLVLLLGGRVLAATAVESRGFEFARVDLQGVGDLESVPYGLVTAITQDRDGLLWIGTQNGLLRFDGYRFRRFVHRLDDPASLGGDYIRALQFGADGRLWIATFGDGVSIFDPREERFETLREGHSALPDDRVHALLAEPDGRVWIGSEGGLTRWDPAGGLGRVETGGARAVRSLLRGHDGRLWLGTRDGLWTLDARGLQRPALPAGSDAALDGETIAVLFAAADGKIWFGTEAGGAGWLDPASGRLRRLPTGVGVAGRVHPRVLAIAQPDPGQVWLGSYGGGIAVVAADDGRLLQPLRHDPAVPTSLAFDNVNALFSDASGLLWVGTWGGGLQFAHPRQQAFRAIRAWRDDPRGLSTANVRSVLELDDGRIWVGTGGNGIDILDRERGRIDGIRAQPGVEGALPDPTISALAQTADGSVWVGTQQSGLLRQRPGQARFERFGTDRGLPDPLVYRLLAAADGGLWIGTRGGLAHWPAGATTLQDFSQGAGERLRAAVWDLDLDGEGRLWVSSEDGLWVYAAGMDAPRPIRHAPQRADSLAHDFVNAALVDRDGRLWADTALGVDRLLSWDGAQARFEHISARLGRPGLYLDGNLLLDRRGRIWNQRFVLDPDAMRLDALGRADGIDFGTSWFGAFAALRDGRFLFGGSRGLVLADPERFRRWDYAPPVAITAAWVGGRPVAPARWRDGLRLGPDQRGFAVEFAALDFSAPAGNRYRYRLQGFDADWIETDAEHRLASYTNLPAGDYQLEIEGSGRNGDVRAQPLRIAVVVVPAFWQTPAFALLALLAAAAILLSGYRWRLRALRARTHALETMVAERTAQLRYLALHDQLTGLPLLSIARERLQQAIAEAAARHEQVALLFLDLDGFKAINDAHGHEAGDVVLQEVGRRLHGVLGNLDLAARIGGDEFIVIARQASAERAAALATAILDQLARPVHLEGEPATIGVSIGIALYPQHGAHGEALRRAADAAMYEVKRSGKNGYAFARADAAAAAGD